MAMALIKARLENISPAFPSDLVTYVYKKTKRVEISNMAHGLGERPTFSAVGRQTSTTGEETTPSHKAPRSVDMQYANYLQPSSSGFSLEHATWSPADHSSCHRLGGLLYKSPLKTRQRHPETPRHDTSPKATGSSVMPSVKGHVPQI